MANRKKIKVAVIGGGCAAMAAVWELSHARHAGRYEITVYQDGWRLGGKGASGRNPDAGDRIEEHGLHVWLGFYDNAFRMMRQCYAELAEKAEKARPDSREKSRLASFGDWREAWIPQSDVALFSHAPGGGFERWEAHMPPRRGLPGDELPPGEAFSLSFYVARAFELFRALVLDTTVDDRGAIPSPADSETGGLANQLRYVARLATFTTAAALAEAFGLLATLLPAAPNLAVARRMVPAIRAVFEGFRRWLFQSWIADDERRFIWEIADLTMAAMVGVITSGAIHDERGLDVIDDYECRDWLRSNGASDAALQSPFLRGLFDLSMGYLGGDPAKPCLSAGQGLRGTLRAFFGYRGAFMWRMRAGMGDVVFAPLYEALKRRGVSFEFFHRLTNIGVSNPTEDGGSPFVDKLVFDVQARTLPGKTYDPLVEVQGRPCWPARPLFQQLVGGEDALGQYDFESRWSRPFDHERTLRVSKDFDLVLLGVGLGEVPLVCHELICRDDRWKRMTEEVKTVASQAVQLWLTEDLATLGWASRAPIAGAFEKPFDTWCDMAHVVPEEGWETDPAPKTSVYFCAVLQDPADPRDLQRPDYPARRQKDVRDAAEELVRGPSLQSVWPGAYDKHGEFRWDLLVAAGAQAANQGASRLDAQYIRANVNPSDRYVIHTPGAHRYRISPLDPTYDNFTIAGDWTDSGFHSGCVEGAVMSGLLAAHALSEHPKLEDIIAYDHP